MKLNKLAYIAFALILLAGFFWIQERSKASEHEFPKADASELWQHITEKSPYTVLKDDAWHFLPGWEGRKEGQSPHGAGIITYVNEIAYQAAKKKQTTLPNHSIVVKENYAPAAEGNKQSALWPNAKLGAVTVMYKIDDYNPEAGNWYWVKYRPDGSVDTKGDMKIAGKVQSCIGCHARGSGEANDYLIGYDLSAMMPAKAMTKK